MSTNNEHSDFTNFRNYYTGNMSPEEGVAFEKHLEQDPFAKEAFEGFLVLENNHARISAIENTNMALKDKFGISTSAKMFPLKYIVTIAASLVLFIGSYFIIQSNLFSNNTEFADNHIENKEISEIIEDESVVISDLDTLGGDLETDLLSDSVIGEYAKNDILVTEVEEELAEDITKDIAVEKKSNNKKEKTQKIPAEKVSTQSKQISATEFDYYRNLNENTKTTDKKLNNVAAAPATVVDKDVSRQFSNTIYSDDSEVVEMEELSKITEYKKGIVAYNKSEYSKAIKHFGTSISQNKSLSGSNYYTAMAYFNQNKSLKAIKYFNKTIEGGSTYKDNAMWYKSLTLLRRGEKIEAKNILKKIAASNSSYSNAALKKLNSLN